MSEVHSILERAGERLRRPAAPDAAPTGQVLTVKEARRVLANTRGLSVETIDAAGRTIANFQAMNPAFRTEAGLPVGASGLACRACGSGLWSIHVPQSGDECWACAACHRPPLTESGARELKSEQLAKEVAEAAAAEVALKAAGTARERLAAVRADLAQARTAHDRVAAAGPASIEAVVAARTALDAAEAALAKAKAAAVTGRVEALLSPGGAPKKAQGSVLVEMTAVGEAAAALEAAQTARATIDDQLTETRDRVRFLEQRAPAIAVAVIAEEAGPGLVETATRARNELIAALQGLEWLLKNGVGPKQAPGLVACLDRSPGSSWPDIGTAGHGAVSLIEALASLQANAAAPIG
jgi:hypothetical protein